MEQMDQTYLALNLQMLFFCKYGQTLSSVYSHLKALECV